MNRKNQETFHGASTGRPTGRRHDEVPMLSRSRSTEVLGVLAAQFPSPEVPGRPVQNTKLGGPPTRVCRGAPHLPQRPLPVYLGDMFEEVSTLSRSCVLEKKSAVCGRDSKSSTRSTSHLQGDYVPMNFGPNGIDREEFRCSHVSSDLKHCRLVFCDLLRVNPIDTVSSWRYR